MAGLIKREDVALVREKARIEDVVAERVKLKPAGAGSLQGLCPFHDERTPSFHIRPALGLWHCFGCGEGGDVISFVQKIDSLGFAEAVEYLAGRFGVQLHYEEGGGRPTEATDPNRRRRLTEANRLAAEFFAERLAGPDAIIGRTFLDQRGFDRAAAERFGVGFAPPGWDNLLKHLRGRGFTEDELVASGLASQGNRGSYDRFRGRLIFPIRDVSGQVVGFGARRLADDDNGPKYLNTPETMLYKKSQVLYGIDVAKKRIALDRQVVVVEGYTDVMAMHLAGIETAVATCGTAFGADHIRIIRRLLGDTGDAASGVQLATGSRGGEIIFTFDGDEAGQKAAMRAFAEDQRFYAQTFVAIAPAGMDPCELRQQQGDGALRDLIAAREPLFKFAITSALRDVDLDTAEGRVSGLRLAAPVVARIRDRALAAEYARQLSGWLGMAEGTVRQAVSAAGKAPIGGSGAARQDPRGPADDGRGAGSPGDAGRPEPGTPRVAGPGGRRREDPVAAVERRVLQAALQHPELVPPDFDGIGSDAFTVPGYRAVADAIAAAGGVSSAGDGAAWLEQVREYAAGPVDGIVTELAVEPLPVSQRAGTDRGDPLANYVRGVTAALLEVGVIRQIADRRAKLQRMDPTREAEQTAELFAELSELEQQRRALRDAQNSG